MLCFYSAGFLVTPRSRFSVENILRSVFAIIAIQIVLVETVETVPCQGNQFTWSAGFGGCDAYTQDERFHTYCDADVDPGQGLTASQACPECGVCKPATTTTITTTTTHTETTATTTSLTTGTTTTVSKMMCKGVQMTWNARFGGCDAYSHDARFHMYCKDDIDRSQGLAAAQACPECGLCEPATTITITTTTTTSATAVATNTSIRMSCKGSRMTWSAGFGGCDGYRYDRRFHYLCNDDVDPDQGFTATETCPECGACEPACDNRATQKMTRKGHTCTTFRKLGKRCRNNAYWRINQFCQKSCWEQGFGYDGDNCSMLSPTPKKRGQRGKAKKSPKKAGTRGKNKRRAKRGKRS